MAKKEKLVEQFERMKYLSNYKLNESEVEEGWGKNLAAGAMMTAASMLPMKQAQAQTNQNIDNKPRTEMSTQSTINNDNFQKTVKSYEKQGYKGEMGSLPDILIHQNIQNLPIQQTTAVGQTETAASMQALQKAGNPMKKFIMTKVNDKNNVEVIIFYVK